MSPIDRSVSILILARIDPCRERSRKGTAIKAVVNSRRETVREYFAAESLLWLSFTVFYLPFAILRLLSAELGPLRPTIHLLPWNGSAAVPPDARKGYAIRHAHYFPWGCAPN